MKFRKMHGLGNDFVIIDARTENVVLMPEDMELIADRHWGVGCDLLTIMDASDKADITAYFFNADGSESGACGNATRCVADIIMSESGKDICTIEVMGGILNCRKMGEQRVQVDMGEPKDVVDLELSKDCVGNPVSVNMGNPHCVFFVDNLVDIDVEKLGAYFETHEAFPNRSNVEFVQVIDKTHLRQKTWERGVGMTEACGSGACAVAVAAVRRGLVERKVEIELDGGLLQIELDADNHVQMSGPVAYVFEGVLAV
ncbi:MAG: diaminopimelate epimerase [Alphaproteobacteria bacterium]